MVKIQRLNMDNSWWVDLNGVKILIDPWLVGTEVDYFGWFNTQWHRTKPISLDDLPDFDLVLITQKYPDHFHKETLQLIQPKLIVGPKSIGKSMNKILPSSQFIPFDRKIKNVGELSFNLHHLPTKRKIDPIYDALIIEDGKNAIFLATHGFALDEKNQELLSELPDFDLLLTPFNRYKLPVFLGGEVAPGIKSVEKLIHELDPKFVAATHDEDKHAKGIVSKFAKIDWSPNKDVLKENPIIGPKYLAFENYQIQTL
ncbi:MAG: MBL fold metallo-hydrolase [Crocinitomicaceae bacterium]|nr:MBL fold metallo-hydrolase [Crocinitomicaceae bacterium]